MNPIGAAREFFTFELATISDATGTIRILELLEHGSSAFERVYFVTDVPPDERRGGHAHRDQDEYVICVSGSVRIFVQSFGIRDTIVLSGPGSGLFIPRGYWRELDRFAPATILAVVASHRFDEADYIRDFAEFEFWEKERNRTH